MASISTQRKMEDAAWRRAFAKAAMIGILANPNWQRDQAGDPNRLARCCTLYADAMIKELRRKP